MPQGNTAWQTEGHSRRVIPGAILSLSLVLLAGLFLSCQATVELPNPGPTPLVEDISSRTVAPISSSPSESQGPDLDAVPSVEFADVTGVTVTGASGSYQFSVTVRSPDTGCDQYSDWWEVIDQDGNLIYRRVLLHSHVGEQPFTRSGGPVILRPDQTVWVRAHLSTGAYGGVAFTGSVAQEFQAVTLEPSFAAQVELQPPLPSSCAF